MQPELIAARSPLAYRCFHHYWHIICHWVPFLLLLFSLCFPPSLCSVLEVITVQKKRKLLADFEGFYLMQHDVPVIQSISGAGTVTNSDAAAVACLNVITRMKGRILIKTISPPHLLPSPLFKSCAGGCGVFSGFYICFF